MIPLCLTGTAIADGPSVTRQQNLTRYWWEDSASTVRPPAYASDIVGQCNKTGGVTFRAALVGFGKAFLCRLIEWVLIDPARKQMQLMNGSPVQT